MPTYEYRCSACGHQYEQREGFDAPSVQKCPNCRGSARRVLHPPPIVFKGSGFYATDSRKSSSSSGPSGDSSGDSLDTTAAAAG